MKRYLAAIPLTAALCLALFTGAPSAESKYNLVFLGERMDAGDIRSVTLGGGMQIIDDSLSVLQLNPAMLTLSRKTTFGAAQYFTSDRGESPRLTETDASFKFTSFSFAFPVTKRLSFSVGYRSRYDGDGHILTNKKTGDGEPYGEFFNRSGGLTSYPVSGAFHVSDWFRVGAFYSLERGKYLDRWDIIFADRSKNPAISRIERKFSGTAYGGGVVLMPAKDALLGVTYEGEIDYDTDVKERHTNSISNVSFSETTILPARWTVSGLWKPVRLYAFYATYSFADFKDFEGMAFPAERLYQSQLVSVGMERYRSLRIGGRSFPLRASVTYEKLPYDFPEGERISKLVFGFGTGLNFRSGKGKIDVAIQGGAIGDTQTNGLRNRMIRVYIGVSGSEIWKRERQSEF